MRAKRLNKLVRQKGEKGGRHSAYIIKKNLTTIQEQNTSRFSEREFSKRRQHYMRDKNASEKAE